MKNSGVAPTLQLAYNQLPKHPIFKERAGGDFKADILFLVFSSVFVEDAEIRSQAAFEARLAEKKSALMTVCNEAGKQLTDIMANYQSVRMRLKQPGIAPAVRLDVENQLGLLLYGGFIRHTPLAQLQAIPRYLKAIEFRIDKQKPDTADVQGLQRLSQRYWQYIEKQTKTQQPVPERDKFRWNLEELRVSIFAQQLKTAYPVSVQRLEKQWNEMF